MKSIKFDDGIREIIINDDPNKVIKWNPTDVDFMARFYEFVTFVETLEKEKLPALREQLDKQGNYLAGNMQSDDHTWLIVNEVRELGREINKKIDETFNANISEIAFSGSSPLSPTSTGNFLFVNFFSALMPVIESSFTEAGEHLDKYIASNKA